MNKYRHRILSIVEKMDAQIVLPEISDSRIEEACYKLESMGIKILFYKNFLGNKEKYINYISKLPFAKNWPIDNLEEYINNPLNFSLAMVACGDADGLVAGAMNSSSDVIRSAIRIVGICSTKSIVSSIFFMISPSGDRAFTYADCAVVPEPDSKQLVEIASESAGFHQLITGEEPIVAFLSFSTKGSADHYRVEKVREAAKLFGKKYPLIQHDGEIQLDAAIIPEINQIKAPNSPIKGKANVLIFPNLDAGNIAYKITQRLAKFSAWGPLIQGLNKPVHDLSRGCSVNDIINISLITVLQKNTYANI